MGKGSELASPKFVSKGTQISLKKGDIVSQCTAGGGGYGKPEERNDHDIKRDLVLGYISREEAIDTYGINLENIQNTKPS